MSDIIERARLAVIEVLQEADLPVGTYIDSEKIARAVIASMREPSPEINNAMRRAFERREDIWSAAIDAALVAKDD